MNISGKIIAIFKGIFAIPLWIGRIVSNIGILSLCILEWFFEDVIAEYLEEIFIFSLGCAIVFLIGKFIWHLFK